MIRNILLLAVSATFVAAMLFLFASGEVAWDAPDGWMPLLFFAGCLVVPAIEIWQRYRPARPVLDETHLALTYNRSALGALGLAGALWLAAGVAGVLSGGFPVWFAWLIIPFSAACGLIGFAFACDGRAIVRVDGEGIADLRLIAAKIPWADVRAIELGYSGDVPSIAVHLADPARYAAKRSTLARVARRSIEPVHILAFQLTGESSDILAAIERFAPAGLVAAMLNTAWHEDA